MRAAAVQLNSTEDKESNLAAADRLTRAAADDGAELVVLPEKFNLLGTHEHQREGAEALEGPTVRWARETASRRTEPDAACGRASDRFENMVGRWPAMTSFRAGALPR